MNGAVELFTACRKHGIKPILGCEVYVVDDHARRAPGRLERFHLTLLAATPTGYRNLVKLSSAGFLEGYQRGKPSVDMEQMAAHAEGVIALTGCLQSRFCQHLLDGAPRGRGARARRRADRARSAPTTSTSRSRRTGSPSRTRPTRGSSGSRASSAGRWSAPATSTTCAARTTTTTRRCCACRRSRRSPSRRSASTPTSSICARARRWRRRSPSGRRRSPRRSRSPSAATSSSSSAAS